MSSTIGASIFNGSYDRRVTRGVGGRPPLPFFEIWKKCPDFEKKVPIVSIFVLNFKNILETKTPKFFRAWLFFLVFFYKIFFEVPKFCEISPALKNFWLRTCMKCLKTKIIKANHIQKLLLNGRISK